MEKRTIFNRKDKKKNLKFENYLILPYFLIMILLVVLPLFIMVLYSFQEENSGIFTLSFTLDHYISFFREKAFVTTMLDSIWIAIIATFFTLMIAYPLAYFITRFKSKTKILLVLLVTSPMWINMLLRTLAVYQVFDKIFSFLNVPRTSRFGNFTMVFGLVYMFLPFMFLPIYNQMSKIDKSLIESAKDLGADKVDVMTKVILPLSIPGILSGIMMVFLPAATSLVVPKYLGNSRQLIGDLIERTMIKDGRMGYGAAIAIVLSAFMMIMSFLIRRMDRRSVKSDD